MSNYHYFIGLSQPNPLVPYENPHQMKKQQLAFGVCLLSGFLLGGWFGMKLWKTHPMAGFLLGGLSVGPIVTSGTFAIWSSTQDPSS